MRNTLIIDGDCGICTHFGNFLKTYDINDNYDLVTFNQLVDIQEIDSNKISFENMNFVSDKGIYYMQFRAVMEAMKLTSGVFKLIGLLGSNKIVSFIFTPIYILIRNNRSNISKLLGYKACEVRYSVKK